VTTPKQRRLRKPEQPDSETFPPVIDERFDDMDQADAEFARWRWPGEAHPDPALS
jgi:hypothetical protein